MCTVAYDAKYKTVAKDITIQGREDEKQFDKEVFLLGRVCSHPAIITLLGFSRSDVFGRRYGSIYMEYASGGDLLDMVQAQETHR